MCFILTACASMSLTSDPKRNSNWQAPQRFNADSVYNAALKAISQGDIEIVSHDRQTGIISAKKVIHLPFTTIPSQVPVTVSISKTGNHVVLNTTAYLKGMGTEGEYENIIRNFYDSLFLELKINKPGEQVINMRGSESDNTSVGMPKGRELVTEVQTMLASKNYDPGPADGVWGNKSASALRAYQSDNNIPSTGRVDDATYNSLKGTK